MRSRGGRAAEMSGRDDLREVLEGFDLTMPFLVVRVRVLRMLDLQRFEERRRGWDEKGREGDKRLWIFNAIFWVLFSLKEELFIKTITGRLGSIYDGSGPK